MVWLVGGLVVVIIVATAALTISIVESSVLLDEMRARQPPTLAGAATLFGMVFILVGAGDAVRYLIGKMADLRRKRRL